VPVVEWCKKDTAYGCNEALVSECATGKCRRREIHGDVGPGILDAAYEFDSGEDFANRDGVKPDRTSTRRINISSFRGSVPEALGQMLPVRTVAKSSIE
jgi:hypothetical protein